MRRVIHTFTLLSVLFFTGIMPGKIFAQGEFSSKTDFSAGVNPVSSTVCDINNDGKPDVITANASGSSVSFFINTTTPGATTPSFSIPLPLSTGANPQFVTNADINGDGKQDLIVAVDGASSISFFLNITTPGASSPAFDAAENFPVGSLPNSIVTADFNSDGVIDIACSNDVSNNLTVYLNLTPAGAADVVLSSPLTVPMADAPAFLTAADFNGDGRQDLACSRNMNSATPVSILLNTTLWCDAAPSFSITQIASANTPDGISAGDFNCDGKPDLAVGNASVNIISVLMNTTPTGSSTPVFQANADFAASPVPVAVKAADMNNDGRIDIIATNYSSNLVSVYLNVTSPGSLTPDFSPAATFTTSTGPASVTAGDFNGDYKPDIVTTNFGSDNISIFLNRLTLGVQPPVYSAKTDFSVPDIYKAVPADFNGDGIPDIASANANANTVSVLMNNTTPGATTPVFSSPVNFECDTLPVGISATDINTDGKPDLVTANDGGSISFYINITTPGSSSPAFTFHTEQNTNSLSSIATGDLNGEGLDDIAVTNYLNNRVDVLINKTIPMDTVPVFLDTISFAVGDNPGSIIIKDINGDGLKDIVTGNRDAAFISVLINKTIPGSSLPEFRDAVSITVPSGAYSVSSADFNGDGKADLFTANFNGNTHSIFLNTTPAGDSIPSFTSAFNTATAAPSTITGDFNGDGKPDICGPVRFANLVFIRTNLTTPGALTPLFSGRTNFTTGTNPYGVASADINSDGKPDLLTTNLSDATFSVFLNAADYPLPVELAAFTSSVDKNTVTLNWTTMNEINNSGFDVERNSFGAGWAKIGFVHGEGTTKLPQNYSFTESNLAAGRYNYRLKQIDFNGNYKYYNLQNEVVIGLPDKFALAQNYPNPFNPITKINYELPLNSFVTIKIYDMLGREVMQLVNEVQQAGYYAVNLNAGALSSGTYFYKLSAGSFNDVKKMVVVK